MSEPIGIILPFRDGGTGRTKQLDEALSAWREQTEGLSVVYVITDEDDEAYAASGYTENSFDENILWLKVPAGLTLMEKINYHAQDIADKHEYIQFLAHDIVLRTPWESRFINALKDRPYGMVYGNDLIHGELLATHPFITSNMVKALGFYGCPAVEHNFFDNYWMVMALTLDSCGYVPEVIMEHIHPLVGKAKPDRITEKISTLLESDQHKFIEYMNENFNNDVEKVRSFEK